MADFLWTLIIYPLIQLIEISYGIWRRAFSNYGMAVIGVSFTVTLFCLPLYIIAERWQEIQRQTEKRLKPGIDRIKDAFKGDEQYMVLNTFYRQNHYHPLMALRSSIGLLIQIPFFMAAYSFLSNLEDLRGISFLFIRNMGAPDALFSIGSFNVNILPIAMTLINIIAGAIYTKGFPIKEKIQINAMALLFLVLLYNSPSGLVLYWTMNNVFSLVKNIFYKLKNPLKVLYLSMCAGIALLDIYLLFVAGGLLYKRAASAFAATLLIFIPQFLRFVKFLLDKPLKPLMENKKLCFQIFIFSSFATALFYGFVLTTSLVLSSVQEFSDIDNISSPFYFIRTVLFQSLGLFWLWPICIYFLFGKRIKTLLASFFSILLVISIVNAFFFPGSYGSLDGKLMYTNDILFQALPSLINLMVLFVISAALFAGLRFIPKILSSLYMILAFGFVVYPVINCVKISSGYKEYRVLASKIEAEKNTIKPVFHLSKTGKNVVLMMLDRAQSIYLKSIFDEDPELYDVFSGFTFYPNTVSYNGSTFMGGPPLFAGYEYTPDEINKRENIPLKTTITEALLMLSRIFTEQGNAHAVICDAPWANFSHIPDMSICDPYPEIEGKNLMRLYNDLWKKEHPGKFDPQPRFAINMERNLLYTSLFRSMPVATRSFIYDNGRYLGTSNIKDAGLMLNAYVPMDYLIELTDFNAPKENSYTMIVNDMPHEADLLEPPDYTYNYNIKTYGTGKYSRGFDYCGNAGAIKLVAKWIKFLKEEGVYDNTKIIIAGDHGAGNDIAKDFFEDLNLPENYRKDKLNPLFLVKEFDSEGPLKTDYTFMTNADSASIAVKGVVENAVNPFTGKPVTNDLKKLGAKVCISDKHQPVQHKKYSLAVSDDDFYTVSDNIYKAENWKKGR